MDASTPNSSAGAAEQPFTDETQEVRALLDECREAQQQADSAKLLELTASLLEHELNRCADVVYMLRGDAFYDQRYFEDAVGCYQQCIANGAEDFAMAWYKLGCAFAASGGYEQAGMAFWRAGELEPEHFIHSHQYGMALLEQERWADALTAFTRSLELSEGRYGNYGAAWAYYARAACGTCTEDALKDTSLGWQALKAAVNVGELGNEEQADFPWWHAWTNPAFELARGRELLSVPADEKWAELVRWPKEGGRPKLVRDVLIEHPEW